MVSVVLLMAGKGNRMQAKENKILLPLGDHSLFEYPLSLFLKFNCEVICVISKDDEKIIDKLPKNTKYIFGGKTRQESVRNGLSICTGSYVLIHDAARALIGEETVRKILKMSDLNEAILTYMNVKDTIKQFDKDNLTTLPRNQLIAAATPQCAPLSILKEVYEKAYQDSFEATDDISLIEKYRPDIKINLLLSNEENFKITTPLDYKLAKLIVEMKK